MSAEETFEKAKGMLAGLGGKMLALATFSLIALIIFRVTFVDYVDNYELGYKFDARDGVITALPHTGYVVTPPFVVSVHHVDLRPMQVCISAIQRVLNCKLVEFKPEGLMLFLSWHGRADYDGPSTSTSSNSRGGTVVSETVFQNILKNYAYDGSGKSYPFLRVVRELKPEEGENK